MKIIELFLSLPIMRRRRLFFDKIEYGASTDDCWYWQGDKNQKGYGAISFYHSGRRMRVLAHRVSHAVFKGKIPAGMDMCHSCDNPPCVNPAHLHPGTRYQNMHECMDRGRFSAGVRRYNAKLTEDDIHTIRADTGTYEEIARRYNITSASVSNIKGLKEWAHVPLNHQTGIFRAGTGDRIRGEKQYGAKLKERDVLYIRQSSDTYQALADRYGVSLSAVYAARQRLTWKHLP